LQRFVESTPDVVNDTCQIIIATSNLALDDDVWVMQGGDLTRFQAHPVALWNHDPEHPVGTVSNIVRTSQKITGKVTFAPPGTTRKSDEVRGLVKSGIVTGVSAGIVPLESEPINPNDRRGGQRITKWILMEVSFVATPADTASAVTARAGRVPRHGSAHPRDHVRFAPEPELSYWERQADALRLRPSLVQQEPDRPVHPALIAWGLQEAAREQREQLARETEPAARRRDLAEMRARAKALGLPESQWAEPPPSRTVRSGFGGRVRTNWGNHS
jgi:HK97 family phage prohead protease